MSRRNYPRIGRVEHERRWAKLPQNQGPRCQVCGAKATHWVHVEVSWFRGDDEVVKACGSHLRDARALLAAAIRPEPAASGALASSSESVNALAAPSYGALPGEKESCTESDRGEPAPAQALEKN